jgi:tRNA A37 threonylcarbamoyladenosine synthetase subunit TsaC/SUA5/YrdC
VALPFNGIWALFGDLNRPAAYERIMAAKRRPADRRLAQVVLPEDAHYVVDFSRVLRPGHHVVELWQEVHGLGIILPARPHVDAYLARIQPSDGSVLLVWTEYAPLRCALEHFRALGGTALFGTSSNTSGQPTHTTIADVWRDFQNDVDAVVGDDFSHLPHVRRQSTTILDLTGARPVLRRQGSVTPAELQDALSRRGFGELVDSVSASSVAA